MRQVYGDHSPADHVPWDVLGKMDITSRAQRRLTDRRAALQGRVGRYVDGKPQR